MSAASDLCIRLVKGRRVWDSRGRPTVEVEVHLADGAVGRAIAPAGASRGRYEAIDLRDGGEAFGGLGVGRALAGIADEIAPALAGLRADDQAEIDRKLIDLDGNSEQGAARRKLYDGRFHGNRTRRCGVFQDAALALPFARRHGPYADAACSSFWRGRACR